MASAELSRSRQPVEQDAGRENKSCAECTMRNCHAYPKTNNISKKCGRAQDTVQLQETNPAEYLH